MIHPHPKHMVVTSSNLSNEMFEFNNQSGYIYSILEVSDISLIILFDKEASTANQLMSNLNMLMLVLGKNGLLLLKYA